MAVALVRVSELVRLEDDRTCRKTCCLADSHDHTGGTQCLARVTDRTLSRTPLPHGSQSDSLGTL